MLQNKEQEHPASPSSVRELVEEIENFIASPQVLQQYVGLIAVGFELRRDLPKEFSDGIWFSAAAVTQILAALSHPPGRGEWQPIETAPRDWTPIDLYVLGVGRVANCVWADGRDQWIKKSVYGVTEIHLKPSHWMLVPTPPSQTGKG